MPDKQHHALKVAEAYAKFHGYQVDLYDSNSEEVAGGWQFSFVPIAGRKADPGDFFQVVVTTDGVRIVFGK